MPLICFHGPEISVSVEAVPILGEGNDFLMFFRGWLIE